MNTEHKIAVALEYDGSNAPKVSAKGIGNLAEQILELAKQHDIPLQADNELVEILAQIKLGDDIPEQLYYAVAEVIAFAYMLKGKFPEGFEHSEKTVY